MWQQRLRKSPLNWFIRTGILLFLICIPSSLLGAVNIEGVRIRPAPERTRIVFDLSQPVEHKISVYKNPRRLVIDIGNAQLKTDIDNLPLKKTPIINIRYARHATNDLRVVFDLRDDVKPRSFALKPIMQYGDRLVVDLYTEKQQYTPVIQRSDLLDHQMRDVVIAIDAGHGGEDPGAIGHKKLREKDVVLKIASRINQLFEKETGFKGSMTRTGDYYVGKKERRLLARKVEADVFLSIHADAFKTSAARGASVYALSLEGATNETAKWLADQASLTDLIGGVGGVSLDDKEHMLKSVLVDLSMTHTLAASLDLGSSVLGTMKNVTPIHGSRKVEQAAFTVLKNPDILSILVETGYVSNPKDARALKSKSHQAKLARAIVSGVKKHLVMNPPDGSYLSWKKAEKNQRFLTHVIQRGDTLTEIAGKYRISAAQLKKVNGLRSDAIKVGQVLTIPGS